MVNHAGNGLELDLCLEGFQLFHPRELDKEVALHFAPLLMKANDHLCEIKSGQQSIQVL